MAWHGSYRVRSSVDETGLLRPPFPGLDKLPGVRFRETQTSPVRHFSLVAVSPSATYPRVEIWASASDLAPLRADYYLTSGKLLKTGWFSEPEKTRDSAFMRSTVFRDDASPDTVTVMTTTSLAAKKLHEELFTVRGLPVASCARLWTHQGMILMA